MPIKRLLIASDEMEVGGSQRQIRHLLGGLDRAQWQPELVFFRNRTFLVDELEQLGITVHYLPKRHRFDPAFVLRYAALLHRGRYELVHAFSLTAELWTTIASLAIRKPPLLVSSVRGLYLTESSRFWRLKRFVIHRSSAMIANARACAMATARRTGFAQDSFDVVANGVVIPSPLDDVDREALRVRIGVPAGRSLGLFVGRLVKEKNLACLVRAMAGLPESTRPWLALVGDGPLRGEIAAMAAAQGIEPDLHFLGERRDTTELMQAADFLVLPSCQEGMSNAILEAMAAGCPVIASAVGGNRELVVDGQTGLLFPNDDARALGECLTLLSTDTALRMQLSSHARQRAETHHAVARMIGATVAVYERCLREPARRTDPAGTQMNQHPSTGGGA